MPRPSVRLLLPFLLAMAALVFTPSAPAKGRLRDSDKLQTEIDAINLQLDYLKLKLSDSLKKTRNLEARIKAKRGEISELQTQVDQLGERQNEITSQVISIENESQSAREQIGILLTRFRARLVQLHKIKQGTLIGSIFSARDLNSFLNRYQMVKYLLNSDKDLLQQLKSQHLRQRKLASEMQARQQQLESGKAELAEKSKKLDSENSALKAMLSTVLLEKKVYLEKEKALAAARKTLENEIAKVESTLNDPALERELTKTPPRNAVTPDKPGRLPAAAPDAAKIMNFMWPVVKSQRKATEQIGDEYTAALYVAVPGEVEVQSAARGKVAYRGNISGLGSVVIIGHLRGFSTVYARLDDIWVGLGQIVERGEVIGRILGGRNQTLHFEIRFGGKKQHPLNYLPEE
ncbi:MAG TPA: hypothetical protein DCG57_05105 [Candidatus Riflebacteria bacterium]|nr:hypothetical protein [Candidatus Riflebacteria bacterium]